MKTYVVTGRRLGDRRRDDGAAARAGAPGDHRGPARRRRGGRPRRRGRARTGGRGGPGAHRGRRTAWSPPRASPASPASTRPCWSSVNYFGAIALAAGLRPQLAARRRQAGRRGPRLQLDHLPAGLERRRWRRPACATTRKRPRGRGRRGRRRPRLPRDEGGARLLGPPRGREAGVGRRGHPAQRRRARPDRDPDDRPAARGPPVRVFADAYPTALGRPGPARGGGRRRSASCSPTRPAWWWARVVYVDGGTDALLHPLTPMGMQVNPIGPRRARQGARDRDEDLEVEPPAGAMPTLRPWTYGSVR